MVCWKVEEIASGLLENIEVMLTQNYYSDLTFWWRVILFKMSMLLFLIHKLHRVTRTHSPTILKRNLEEVFPQYYIHNYIFRHTVVVKRLNSRFI